MKKRMVLVICGILVLSLSLCACNVRDLNLEEPGKSFGEPIEIEPEDLLPDILPANEFKNEDNLVFENGNIVVRPRHMYWEDGMLVAECFISNGLNATVYNLEMESLIFENDDGRFADGSFGLLEGASIAPHSYITWTFRFSGDAVEAEDADLTGRIHHEFSVSYSY